MSGIHIFNSDFSLEIGGGIGDGMEEVRKNLTSAARESLIENLIGGLT